MPFPTKVVLPQNSCDQPLLHFPSRSAKTETLSPIDTPIKYEHLIYVFIKFNGTFQIL